jgi:hypothetical protein
MTKKEEPDEENNENLAFHVIQTKAIVVDPTFERVFCPYCHSLMKYLPGFPQGHAQWLCTSCAQTAYEAYGDRPSYDTDYKSLSSPNDPYATEDNTTKTIIRDLPSPDDDQDERSQQWGRVDVNTADKRKRYGMRFAFLTAQEASKQI